MLKKSTTWLILMLCVLVPLIAACGSTSRTPTGTSTPPSGENLYVLDGYTSQGANSTNARIVAFHPGSVNPSTLLTLPAGLTSLNHQRLYTATPTNGETTISIINTQTGSKLRSFTISGSYTTSASSFDNSVISTSGQWLALRELGQPIGETVIALIDTQAGKLAKTFHLNGDFTLDAVNPDGSRVYLLERLNDGSGHYYVRLYDVTKNQLYQSPIVDKTELNDPNMTGTAVARQMAGDGTMAYTLYVDAYHNIAFVHVLPLTGDLYGAHCVLLPVGKSADLLHYYTLTMSSDESTLYAANGALGVVSEISLNGPDSSDIFDDKVVATVHFNPGSVSSSDKTRMLYNGAALSPDGKTLYIAGIHGIWPVNTLDLHAQHNSAVLGNYLAGQGLTSVAVSADGRTLYAVDPTNGITVLNTATGQTQQVILGPAHAPWGIEWIDK